MAFNRTSCLTRAAHFHSECMNGPTDRILVTHIPTATAFYPPIDGTPLRTKPLDAPTAQHLLIPAISSPSCLPTETSRADSDPNPAAAAPPSTAGASDAERAAAAAAAWPRVRALRQRFCGPPAEEAAAAAADADADADAADAVG